MALPPITAMDITLPIWVTILMGLGGLAGIAALIQANLAVRKQAFDELKEVIRILDERVDGLRDRVRELESENKKLKEENVELRETVKNQAQEIGELERRLDER